MDLNKWDVAVIGSGPGGFNAAVRAKQLGARVVLVDKSFVGGTCLNSGCIPTKFLWQVLKTRQIIKKSYEYGLKASLEPIVFTDIVAKKDRSIANIRKGMDLILASYSIDIIKGVVSFKDRNSLIISDDVRTREIFADKIIIATGTKPSMVEKFRFDGVRIINSTDVLNLKKIPKNMLIIGGGPIGIEMATIFSIFGCQITLVEREKRLFPEEDVEVSAEIERNLSKHGVKIFTTCINAFDSADKYEKVLVVIGRTPNNDLNLENAGVKTINKGFIETNKFCQTNVDNIYAVGDIAGKNLLAYTAQSEGSIAAENAIKGNYVAVENFAIPQVVFSIPQSSSVKVQDYQNYQKVAFGKFPFIASSRAFVENERGGFVKCAVDKISKKPLAFWIVGAHADELINIASQILKSGMNYISRETMFHPSLGESLFNAYEDAFKKCTELIKN
jgi:dihydrolipoamide dehydrogenase